MSTVNGFMLSIYGGVYKGPSRETTMRYTAELATQVCNGSCRYPFLYIAGISLTDTSVSMAQREG
jgi:hypothetical protein